MKKVITYGTFDLLHHGHMNILRRAKELGDYLVVGVTSDAYDRERGKLNVRQPLAQRIENVRSTGFADEIIVEEYEGQKISDIDKYDIDVFVIGSDWEGKFEYLKPYCEVVYAQRTRGVSSTQLRSGGNPIIPIGVIGSAEIAKRFILESKYVSGVNVAGVYNPNAEKAKAFADEEELEFYTDSLDELFEKTQAVYIASPHFLHHSHIIKALNAGKHVLCEKPITLSEKDTREAFDLAGEKGLVLMEGIKTAYCPAFEHLLLLAKSGRIGEIKDVEASFTKLFPKGAQELDKNMHGGSINELASYVCLPIFKLLGLCYKDLSFHSIYRGGVDVFTRGMILYENASASFKVGLGVKTEGELVISGTKGYIYVPAPWWLTDYFEMRFENPGDTNKYFYRYDGDGLRYELVEFVDMIQNGRLKSGRLTMEESVGISKMIESFGGGEFTKRMG